MSTREELGVLHAEMRRCTRCPDAGFGVRAGAVFSGPPTARWMIVGQAPGETESTTRTPFCGPSGRRLFRWLADAGWSEDEFRAAQYITALTKCYPGKAAGGRGDRVPTRLERGMCESFLSRELELVAPNVVVAVGSAAVERFLGRGGLDERVGCTFDLDGRTIVPLPHPSGANLWLNRARSKELLLRALAAARALRTPEDV